LKNGRKKKERKKAYFEDVASASVMTPEEEWLKEDLQEAAVVNENRFLEIRMPNAFDMKYRRDSHL
jgi:hypothetical protein